MVDLLQISLGTTRGLRSSDAFFQEFVARAGATIETVGVRVGTSRRLRRAYPVTDLVEALAARRAAASAVARTQPRAVVFSTTTAALLAADPGMPFAVRLDAPARLNRPGIHNAVLHALERRKLARATVVLPTSEVAAAALPRGAAQAVVVPPPIFIRGAAEPVSEREQLAVAYTPDPKAKGLDLLCRAWELADVRGARLEVYGLERGQALRRLRRDGVPEPRNVRFAGSVPTDAFHRRLSRAVTFITSARWEDFGMAQLEALALGALLVCTATRGPFEAGALARALAPELVAHDQRPESLAACIGRAFALGERDVAEYRRAAQARLTAYRPDAIARTIAQRVLPALL